MDDNVIIKKCKNCGCDFEINENDKAFYREIKVPEPTFCPICREQRRLLWCNERRLYKRQCDLSGEKMLSNYPEDVEFPVYHVKNWWSDKWNAMDYGRDFDFSKPFFDQWYELYKVVPEPSLNVTYELLQNCDYVNYVGKSKNCYLVFDSDYCQDCYYCYTANHSTNTVDCLKTVKSELCYECVDCKKCYNTKYSINSYNCTDSYFLKNCIGCKDCFGCINVKNKQYYFFNEQLSKEDYFSKIKEYNLKSRKNVDYLKEEINKFFLSFPNKYFRGVQNINFTGDNISNCKNTFDSFDCQKCEDCRYCYSVSLGAKRCYDIYQFGEGLELSYESAITGYNSFDVKFSILCFEGNSNIEYCHTCMSCKNCFGCVGLRHKEYCILNKQYTKDEYHDLKDKIVKHMMSTGEYGEFFPAVLSPFCANITQAQEFLPLNEADALSKGYKWENRQNESTNVVEPSDNINDIDESILQEILSCNTCGRNYKIIKQELNFYKKQGIPIPIQCPDCRHSQRIKLRNKQKLYNRECDNCKVKIRTSYSDKQPEKVLCEECYLKEVI